MMKLMRELRCFPFSKGGLRANSWSGSPGNTGLSAFWVVRTIVLGPVSASTGYVCDIRLLDALMRDEIMPRLAERLGAAAFDFASSAEAFRRACAPAWSGVAPPARVDAIQWHLCPYLHLRLQQERPTMIDVTLSFEFSASHRLHNADLSEEENARLFGKCANPNGHGHNYVVDVTLHSGGHSPSVQALDLERVQRIVHDEVIKRFDHKHLNLDCAEFQRLNPSVENIAVVVWNLLAGHFGRNALRTVRVWETPKTYAEYDGNDEA